MSASYPYLALSRRLGVPYGTVLLYADYIQKVATEGIDSHTLPELKARDKLSGDQQKAVIEVWKVERDRQKNVNKS
jgi:hypothetical protein